MLKLTVLGNKTRATNIFTCRHKKYRHVRGPIPFHHVSSRFVWFLFYFFFLFYTLYLKKKLKTRAKQFKQFPRGDYVILTPTEVTNTCQMSTALNCESTRNCGVRGEVVQSVVVLVNYTLCGCVPKWAKSPRHKIHMETFIIKMDPVTTISSTFLILKIN